MFEEILTYYGISIEDYLKGGEVLIFCPFCDDIHSDNASCQVNIDADIFHCWACQAGGNVIQFVQQKEQLESVYLARTFVWSQIFQGYDINRLKHRLEKLATPQTKNDFRQKRKIMHLRILDELNNFWKKQYVVQCYLWIKRKVYKYYPGHILDFLSTEMESRIQYLDYRTERLEELFYVCDTEEKLYSFYNYFQQQLNTLRK